MAEVVFKVRVVFLAEFMKHQRDSPGMDGEATFVGTVMHFLNHRDGARIVDNHVFIDKYPSNKPIYAGTYEWVTIAHACAMDRLPLRMFERSFKQSRMAGQPSLVL